MTGGITAAALAYWFIIPTRHRPRFLLGCSVAFCAAVSPALAAYFLLLIALVRAVDVRMDRVDAPRRRLLQLGLVSLVSQLCWFKYSHLLVGLLTGSTSEPGEYAGVTPSAFALPLGISYVTFRLIHYLVERYRNGVPQGSFVDLALYVLFFPTFLAGPVERFDRFHAQTGARLGVEDLAEALWRILIGIVRKAVIADSLATWVAPVLGHPEASTRPVVLLAVYGSAIWLYMDFAGYTDLALGVARLFGYRIVENFHAPFLQKNIALFWRNWHISVYTWVRDYFFLPIFGHRASQAKLYLGIALSMMVFCLWHGASWSFLALGFYHGVGLVLWQGLQDLKRAVPRLRVLGMSRALEPLSVALTFSYVSVGSMFVVMDFRSGMQVLARILGAS